MPDTARPINRHSSDSSRDSIEAPVSMSPGLTTRHQWFTYVRLLGPHLPHHVRLFPRRSPPQLIHRSSSGRFDTCTCIPMPKDLPSSPQQHDNRPAVLLHHTLQLPSGHTNAVAESFFATYKKELIHTRPWTTVEDLTTRTRDWIDNYYNATRRHSTLGYLTPAEYELGYRDINQLAA